MNKLRKILTHNRVAVRQVHSQRKYMFISGASFVLALLLYYVAIEMSASLRDFLQSSILVITIFQIVFILFNSLLIGLSISMFVYSFHRKSEGNRYSVAQTISALFFSVASTGCYVCGSLLLPSIGVFASLGTLAFAGLEIKVLTFLLLLYSINQYSNVILGFCAAKQYRTYELKLGRKSLAFSGKLFDQSKPFFVTGTFVAVMLLLPFAYARFGVGDNVVEAEQFVCTSHVE